MIAEKNGRRIWFNIPSVISCLFLDIAQSSCAGHLNLSPFYHFLLFLWFRFFKIYCKIFNVKHKEPYFMGEMPNLPEGVMHFVLVVDVILYCSFWPQKHQYSPQIEPFFEANLHDIKWLPWSDLMPLHDASLGTSLVHNSRDDSILLPICQYLASNPLSQRSSMPLRPWTVWVGETKLTKI